MRDNVIYYDIEKSPYVFKTLYFDFYFSSQFYMNKFKSNYSAYIQNETDKLKVKFGQSVNFIKPLILDYYKKIEKRGFRVFDKTENTYINLDYKIIGEILND